MTTASTGLRLYDEAACATACSIIRAYSTSFSLATRLLGPRTRRHIRHVYALVRIADEIVDGPADEAGVSLDERRRVLDALEQETADAIARGFSSNLVVHAYARTARECGIGDDLTGPFFDAMRTDLTTAQHDARSHDDYVFGSAEVVGLMCLAVFVNAGTSAPARPAPSLVEGARSLGRAFQDVNFLRDLADDSERLGRDYLGIADGHDRVAVLDRIDTDLARAAGVIPDLPADCRRAVTAAHDLFAALGRRLRASGPGDGRVSVPTVQKAALAVRAWVGAAPGGSRA
jgi:phytoene/squalene synthetase